MLRRILKPMLGAGVLALAMAAPSAPAGAAAGDRPTVLTTNVMGPFQIAVAGSNVFVTDGFLGTLQRVAKDGSVHRVASAPGLAGVAAVPGGPIAYTWTKGGEGATTASGLTVLSGGASRTVDLLAYEKRVNPDRDVTYGIDHPTPCQVKGLAAAHIPAHYKGAIDSHPYAVARLGAGWVVAEAAGNDLLRVNDAGKVSTLTVMPRQPVTIPKSVVEAMGLPKCLIGAVYNFEPVPTDVEPGPDGMLYVTTLPGGPEDASLGARGSVYRVNPVTGAATRLATGFAGATNVAVTASGSIYVAELFGGRIIRLGPSGGNPTTVLAKPGVLAVEAGGGHMYYSTLVPTDGSGNPIPGKTGSLVRLW